MAEHINGIHHVALRCCGKEAFDRAVTFYREVIGFPIVWILRLYAFVQNRLLFIVDLYEPIGKLDLCQIFCFWTPH